MTSSQPSTSVTSPDSDPAPIVAWVAVGLGWLIPGVGHAMLGQWRKALLLGGLVYLLFASGLWLGGVRVISPPDQQPWAYTSYLIGWPAMATNQIYQATAAKVPANADPKLAPPRLLDVGTVYCGIAGMLNLLLISDLLGRALGKPNGKAGSQ